MTQDEQYGIPNFALARGLVIAFSNVLIAGLIFITWLWPTALGQHALGGIELGFTVEMIFFLLQAGALGIISGQKEIFLRVIAIVFIIAFGAAILLPLALGIGSFLFVILFILSASKKFLGLAILSKPDADTTIPVAKHVLGGSYLCLLLLFVAIIPIPEFGLTPEMIEAQGYWLKASNAEWPRQMLAVLILFYGSMGLAQSLYFLSKYGVIPKYSGNNLSFTITHSNDD